METIFSMLSLLDALHDLPQNYAYGIKQFDAKGDITTQFFLYRFTDFVDLEEENYEDFKMRLFVQIFSGEVRKSFKDLPTSSIPNFESLFRGRWGNKKNTLQLLIEYINLKRLPIETIQ
jgi:hypothetical protein